MEVPYDDVREPIDGCALVTAGDKYYSTENLSDARSRTQSMNVNLS